MSEGVIVALIGLGGSAAGSLRADRDTQRYEKEGELQ